MEREMVADVWKVIMIQYEKGLAATKRILDASYSHMEYCLSPRRERDAHKEFFVRLQVIIISKNGLKSGS